MVKKLFKKVNVGDFFTRVWFKSSKMRVRAFLVVFVGVEAVFPVTMTDAVMIIGRVHAVLNLLFTHLLLFSYCVCISVDFI